MQWLRSHAFLIATLVAIAIVLSSIAILERKKVVTDPTTSSWGNTGAALPTPQSTESTSQTVSVPKKLEVTPAEYTSSFYIPPSTSTKKAVASENTSALTDLITQIGASMRATSTVTHTKLIQTVDPFTYFSDFIPSAPTPAERSPEQLLLYDYGNTAGSYIRAFDTRHPNMVQILTDHAKDRSNPVKAAALRGLGDSYRALGEQIRTMRGVPQIMDKTNESLAASYSDIGSKLIEVSTSNGDKDFIQAITSYNASAEIFTRAYIAVATLLSVNNVRFAESDGGSMFSFQAQ